MQRFLPANVVQDLEFIRPLMHHVHEAIARLNESYVERQIAAFKAFFDGVETTP
jgi:DNA helicase-4